MNINAVLSDLRADARRWDTASEEFGRALKILDSGATLPYATFDGITHALGATRSYEATLEQIRTLVSGATTETGSIAERLRSTATNIEKGDYEAR